MKISINEKKVDLALAFPLTLGDLRALGKGGMLNAAGDVEMGGIEGVIGLLMHVSNKALKAEGTDVEISEEDVETVPVNEMAGITSFFAEAMASEETDRPT
jgi:hypothetical protein